MVPSQSAVQSNAKLLPWQAERKRRLIAGHELYGAPLHCSMVLRSLRTKAARSWALPMRWAVAFLIMGEDDVSDKEAGMWSNSSDVLVLTYRTRRADAIFCPDLVMQPGDKGAFSRGRNTLLLAAQLQELRRGWAYQHYVFLDADVTVNDSWRAALPGFRRFLRGWAPAVGVPLYFHENVPFLYTHMFNLEQYVDPELPRSIAWHDQQFVALHRDAAMLVMPLDSRLDTADAMMSQWKMISLASILFRGHVLLYMGMEVRNPKHERDPDVAVQQQMENVSAHLRARVPRRLRHCVLDPWNMYGMAFSDTGFRARRIRGYVKRNYRHRIRRPVYPVFGEHGFIWLHSYFPWGSAARKRWDYRAATLDSARGCDDEPEFRAFWWARKCWGPHGRSVGDWLTCSRFNLLGADPR